MLMYSIVMSVCLSEWATRGQHCCVKPTVYAAAGEIKSAEEPEKDWVT